MQLGLFRRLILLQELLLWEAGEIAAGRLGSYRLSFPGYLSNRVLRQQLRGYRLETVLLFLLERCAKDGRFNCLDVLAYRHSESLPLSGVDNLTLSLVRNYCKRKPHQQHAVVRQAIEREILRRAAEE